MIPHSSHFSSSILLWMRQDRPRQDGMDYWRGPHAQVIAATPKLDEYRQVHMNATNPGRWPRMPGVETAIPEDRRIDGIAEVTFQSPLAPLAGRKQTAIAYQDEVNLFRRTLMYAGPPGSSRWYDVGDTAGDDSPRSVLFIRRSADTAQRELVAALRSRAVPELATVPGIVELRLKTFLPWVAQTWNTPDVSHDNSPEHRFHASLTLGWRDAAARDRFYDQSAFAFGNGALRRVVSGIHAYDVDEVVTLVEAGTRVQ